MKIKWYQKMNKISAGFLLVQMTAALFTPIAVGAAPLSEPLPITPGPGEFFAIDPVDINFTWTDTGATKYRLQKCNIEPVDNTDSGCTSGKSTIADNVFATSFLRTYTTDQNLWWRVAAYNDVSWATSLYGPANQLFIDTTTPSVSIVSPVASSWLKETVNIEINASDATTGVDYVELYVNGTLNGTQNILGPSGYYDFSVNTSLVPDGTYKLKATAYDKTGLNRTTSERTVYIDNALPVVDIAPVGFGSPTGDLFGGSVKIYYSDLNLASVTINGDPAGNSPISVSSEGLHSFVATDKSNNVVEKNFRIDYTAPHVPSVTSTPVTGYKNSGDVINIHVGFDSKVYLTLAGLPVLNLNSGGIATLDPVNSGSGTNVLNFIYKVKTGENTHDLDYSGSNALDLKGSLLLDEAHNHADISLPYTTFGLLALNSSLFIDTEKPVVANINAPYDNYFVSGVQPVRVSSSDNFAGSGIKNVSFFIGGKRVATKSLPTTIYGEYEYLWDTAQYADGQHAIWVRSTDLAGNVFVSTTSNIFVDNTNPTLSKFTVSSQKLGSDGNYYINGASGITISSNISDSYSGFNTASCYFTLNGGISWTEANYEITRCRVTGVKLRDHGFTDGDRSLAIGMRVIDVAGNETVTSLSELISPVVDLANPVVAEPIGVFQAYSGFTSRVPVLAATASDTTSPITGCDYRTKNSGLWSSWTSATWTRGADFLNGNCSATLGGLIDGESYNFQIRVKDTVGRSDSSVSNLARVVDGVVNLIDAGDDAITNMSFTRAGTASDSASGLFATNWSFQNLDSGNGFVSFSNPTGLETIITADRDGRYEVFLTVVDNVGNTRADSFILTWDTKAPVITARGDVIVEATSNLGASVEYVAPTATDSVDGDVEVSCSPVSGSVFDLGTTEVNCSATDTAKNGATSSFSITVKDTTAPVITLNGATTDITVGGTYTELGATASDSVDGDFSATPSGVVNTGAVGSYLITYNATDDAGNVAEAVTRIVNVVAAASLPTVLTPASLNTPVVLATAPIGAPEGAPEVLGAVEEKREVAGETDVKEQKESKEEKNAGLFKVAWYWWIVVAFGATGLWWLATRMKRKNIA